MTLQHLEQRLGDLERRVAELQSQARPLQPLANAQDTFGMFANANDLEFDEIVRLGREYREEVKS